MDSLKEMLPDMLQLIAVIVTVIAGIRNTNKKISSFNELVVYRVSELEKKQDKHNEVIARTYKLEQAQAVQEQEIKDIKSHIKDSVFYE